MGKWAATHNEVSTSGARERKLRPCPDLTSAIAKGKAGKMHWIYGKRPRVYIRCSGGQDCYPHNLSSLHDNYQTLRRSFTLTFEIAMNSSNTTMCSYEPFSCYCLHTSADHALVRCGHPNDRPLGHPLHSADDALHRVWCIECEKWCFNLRDDCPVLLNGSVKPGYNAQVAPAPEKKDRSTCSRMWAVMHSSCEWLSRHFIDSESWVSSLYSYDSFSLYIFVDTLLYFIYLSEWAALSVLVWITILLYFFSSVHLNADGRPVWTPIIKHMDRAPRRLEYHLSFPS